jgi:hypothetical protein
MLAAAQTPVPAQPTAAELLQKGIYTQETAGDLDDAIKIYRQIVDSHPAQREIGAQAQYRLGLTLLAKGDTNGASQEIQRLGWDYPDFKDLIASAKSAGGGGRTITFFTRPYQLDAVDNAKKFIVTGGAVYVAQEPDHDAQFDFSRLMTLTGTVLQVQWLNPYAWLTVEAASPGASPYLVSLDSPAVLMAGGWNRDTVKPGGQITVVGAAARDGSSTLQATSVSANGAVLFTHTAATK